MDVGFYSVFQKAYGMPRLCGKVYNNLFWYAQDFIYKNVNLSGILWNKVWIQLQYPCPFSKDCLVHYRPFIIDRLSPLIRDAILSHTECLFVSESISVPLSCLSVQVPCLFNYCSFTFQYLTARQPLLSFFRIFIHTLACLFFHINILVNL